jgi:hypothetical protein
MFTTTRTCCCALAGTKACETCPNMTTGGYTIDSDNSSWADNHGNYKVGRITITNDPLLPILNEIRALAVEVEKLRAEVNRPARNAEWNQKNRKTVGHHK